MKIEKINLTYLHDLNFENAKINYFRVLNSKKIKSNWKIISKFVLIYN